MKKYSFFIVCLTFCVMFCSGQTSVTLMLPNPCSGIGVVERERQTLFDFDVYPNPTSGQFTLSVSRAGSVGELTMQVNSLVGDVLFQEQFYSSAEKMQTRVDLGMLPVGAYVITLRNSTESLSKKLIISK